MGTLNGLLLSYSNTWETVKTFFSIKLLFKSVFVRTEDTKKFSTHIRL